MKKATLAQGNQVLNLVLQSKIPSDQLQDVIDSGILSDVLTANVSVVDRDKLQEVLGLRVQPGTPVLCYVDGDAAYFTTQELAKQTGDDWNDAPYEHNAGQPYEPYGTPKWRIIKVIWEGPFETPADVNPSNSPYSVQDINEGNVPWLETPQGFGKRIRIMAGTTLSQFTHVLGSVQGGKVKVEE